MTELAVLIPVLRRPHRVAPVLESLRKTVDATVLFLCDRDDQAEQDAIKLATQNGVQAALLEGHNYAAKINYGVRTTTEPLLLFAADDLEFHPGWFEAAKAKLTDGVGVVATNDLCNGMVMAGQLATHPLVTREYTELGTIDEPERVLHEAYPHEYVDREFSETAQKRGAFVYAPDAVVEHLHPTVGKAPTDELYDQMWDRMRFGRRIYRMRRQLWT